MAASRRAPARWRGLPVRVRLAAVQGGLILAAGTVVVLVVYFLLARSVDSKVKVISFTNKPTARSPGESVDVIVSMARSYTTEAVDRRLAQARHELLHQLFTTSAACLAVLVVMAALIGWWLAGRMLRPLNQIAETARRLCLDNLHERIELRGPDDELKRLADTFDDMLARIEQAADSQRRFVANASHELRTPLAVQRTVLQLGLAGPMSEKVVRARRELLTINERSERLIEGLLLMAQSDRGLARREPIPLHEVAGEVLAQYTDVAAAAGVRTELRAAPVEISGDRVLITQLLMNLVQNAIRYNRPGGVVEVSVTASGDLTVGNTGQDIPPDKVNELFEPFVRFGEARSGPREGAGLGLSIVRSIVAAHRGVVVARARSGGGLEVSVTLSPAGSGLRPRLSQDSRAAGT
ncbi:HAMP domain-containing sensor histidine kinase [Streptosporangium sp. NPDC020072]|uniref:sensor histidine kinase n=1 Tax=Streptosporangium sp. NPDC020072 TaxID=3154788 RepID=UPI0034176CAF